MPLSDEEIRDRMTYHRPSPEGVGRHEHLSNAIGRAMEAVEATCPDGREKALAFTNLEQAKMWASAAVARNPQTR